jgi:hypothetical protein
MAVGLLHYLVNPSGEKGGSWRVKTPNRFKFEIRLKSLVVGYIGHYTTLIDAMHISSAWCIGGRNARRRFNAARS